MQANLKNLIIGIVLGLALGLALGANADKESDSNAGRFQIAAHATHPFYVVLDTQTGDVYAPSYPGKAEELYLSRIMPEN